MMKTSILIITYCNHFHWLVWCLRSIHKFATGFDEVVVVVPNTTPSREVSNLSCMYDGRVRLHWSTFDEWPGLGFLHHEYMTLCADELLPDSDFVLHMDADCVFCEPVKPEDYFVDGKPVLIGARYDWVVKTFDNPYHYKWRDAVERALGGKSELEFMRRHPAVHYRSVYPKSRECIQRHTGLPSAQYIMRQQNTFPQGFAEFPTLGEVAWRHFHDQYHWLNQENDPWPHDKLIQFWGHGTLTEANNVWRGGRIVSLVPMDEFRRLGLNLNRS